MALLSEPEYISAEVPVWPASLRTPASMPASPQRYPPTVGDRRPVIRGPVESAVNTPCLLRIR